jgi:glycosyltransferase involved in cell wall biosynthesis
MVPHPIFKQFKATGEQRSNLLERLNLPQNVNNVLFFGFVRPYKGLSDLIMAMKYVCEKDQNIHLVIAGEFWRDREKYDLQIAELNLQENVHIFDHYIPDDAAAQYFEIADIFVAPYARGTQSGALKTALGFGLPTVVTEPIADTMVRSLSELCYIVPAERPKKLANGIITQLRIRKLPQDQIRDIFLRSWEAMIDALTDDCQVPLF